MYVRNDQIRSELSWHFNKLPTNETLKKIQGSNRIGSHDLYHTNAMLLATELHCIKPKIGSKVNFEVMLSWKGVKWKVYKNLEYNNIWLYFNISEKGLCSPQRSQQSYSRRAT